MYCPGNSWTIPCGLGARLQLRLWQPDGVGYFEVMKRSGLFWAKDYFDRWILEGNPVKARDATEAACPGHARLSSHFLDSTLILLCYKPWGRLEPAEGFSPPGSKTLDHGYSSSDRASPARTGF